MVLFPLRNLDCGHFCLFSGSTWTLILHCTVPDTEGQWALLVPLLLITATWRARWNRKSAQCTVRGTVLQHHRLRWERLGGRHPCPSLFIPTQRLEQQQCNEGDAGGKERAGSPAGTAEKTCGTTERMEEEEKVIVLGVTCSQE